MRYKWLCVDDSQTCSGCLVRNNKIYTKKELKNLKTPPLHISTIQEGYSMRGCRCVLVEVV